MKLFHMISAGYWKFRLARRSTRIARLIFPTLWESAKHKIGSGREHRSDLNEYAKSRGAQLAQAHVDEFVASNPRFSSAHRVQLVGLAAAKAAILVDGAATRCLAH